MFLWIIRLEYAFVYIKYTLNFYLQHLVSHIRNYNKYSKYKIVQITGTALSHYRLKGLKGLLGDCQMTRVILFNSTSPYFRFSFKTWRPTPAPWKHFEPRDIDYSHVNGHACSTALQNDTLPGVLDSSKNSPPFPNFPIPHSNGVQPNKTFQSISANSRIENNLSTFSITLLIELRDCWLFLSSR